MRIAKRITMRISTRKCKALVFAAALLIAALGINQYAQPVQAAGSHGNAESRAAGLSAPVLISAQNTGGGITVKWKAVSGASRYRIYRRYGGGGWTKLADTTKVSYSDKDVKAGVTYKYTVKCIEPSTSPYDKNGVAIRRLEAPALISLSNDGSGVTVNFKAVAGAKKYKIYRKTGSGKWTLLGSTASLSYKDKTAKTDKDYTYTVRAAAGGYQSAYKSAGISLRIISWDPDLKYANESVIHSGQVTLYRTTKSAKKGIVVGLNAGHGTKGGNRVKVYCHPDHSPKCVTGSTAAGERKAAAVSSGTTLLDGTTEADAVLDIALVLRTKLLAQGYDVLMIRETKDTQVDNIARTVFANRYADCHVSIHYNSSAENKGAFYVSVPNVESFRNMQPVKKWWKKHDALGEDIIDGLGSAGIKLYRYRSMGIDLVQTSYSTIPSVDVEVGDRASDHSASTVKKIANGIAAGITDFFR